MKRNTVPPPSTRRRQKPKGNIIGAKPYLLGDAAIQFNVQLAQGGESAGKRRALLRKLEYLFRDQSSVPLEEVDLCSIAEKVYRLELTRPARQALCRTICGFFGYAVRRRRITSVFFQKVLLYFRVPEADLPPGVLSLDEIRTALREASTPHSKIGLIFALSTDLSIWPLESVTLSDAHRRIEKQPRKGTSKYGKVTSLVSWLMDLPKNTDLLRGSQPDYYAFRADLDRLGFKRMNALRQTRIAYQAALGGSVARFATRGRISPDTVRKYSVPALDAWAGYAFHFGLTPESCGIRDWPGQEGKI